METDPADTRCGRPAAVLAGAVQRGGGGISGGRSCGGGHSVFLQTWSRYRGGRCLIARRPAGHCQGGARGCYSAPCSVALLSERGLIPAGARIVEHATAEDVRGQDVIGILPMGLAALARSVTEIPLALSPEDRGKELDIERLRQIAGNPVTYVVTRVGEQFT